MLKLHYLNTIILSILDKIYTILLKVSHRLLFVEVDFHPILPAPQKYLYFLLKPHNVMQFSLPGLAY